MRQRLIAAASLCLVTAAVARTGQVECDFDSAERPKATTHYVINLIDEYIFLVSYPEMVSMGRNMQYSKLALSVNER